MKKHSFWLVSIVAGCFFALLYHLTATFNYTYDGLCYALDAEFGPTTNLFHPNHLLYSFLSRVLYRSLLWMGHPVRAIFAMQAMNAVVAGIAIGFFFWILARRFGWQRAWLGAAALGLSHAFWSEAVDPGCYAWAVLAECSLLALLINVECLPPFGLGVAHGIAILFHQMLILVIPAFVLRLGKRKPTAAYLLGVCLVVGGAYAGVAAYFHGGSLSEALYWALGPAGPPPDTPILSHYWWSLNLAQNLVAFWQGLVHSIITEVSGPWSGAVILWNGIMVLWVVFVGVESVRYFKSKSIVGNETGALGAWIVTMGVFQFFFWIGAVRYRLLFLPPLIYLAFEFSRSYRDPILFGALGLAVLLAAGVNYHAIVGPQSHLESNPSLVRALWVSQTLHPKDAFLFAGGSSDSIINVYMPYFAPQIRGRSVRGYFFAHPHGDLADLRSLVEDARRSGNSVFVEATLWDPSEQKTLEELGQVAPGTLQKWLAQLKRRGQQTGPDGYSIYQVY